MASSSAASAAAQQQRLRSKSTDALHRQQNTSSPNYRMDSGTLKKMLKPVNKHLNSLTPNQTPEYQFRVRGP